MEKLHVPAVVISTEPFIQSSKAMAVAQGIPDYPFVVIGHPIAASETTLLQQWAEDAIEEVVDILLTGKQQLC